MMESTKDAGNLRLTPAACVASSTFSANSSPSAILSVSLLTDSSSLSMLLPLSLMNCSSLLELLIVSIEDSSSESGLGDF